MNFSFDASKAQGSTPITTTTTSTPVTGAITFGATGAGDAGKQMTTGLTTTPTQNKTSGLFKSGLNTGLGQPTGFTFGTSPNTSATAFGTPTSTAAAPGLTFGSPSTSTTTPNVAVASTAAPIRFGTTPATTTGFSLGTPNVASSSPTTGLSFGISKPLGQSGLTFGTPNSVATSTPRFSLASATPSITTTTTTPSFTFGGTATTTSGTTATTTTASTFSLGTATTASTTTGFSFGTPAITTSTTGFMLNKTTAVTTSSSLATTTAHTSLGTTTTVSSSASGSQSTAINFCQLEESINKWTLELEEQEKVFVNQATQVNAWDKLLIINGEKIIALNQEVERVKLEQQQLEHELDYVVGQQKELQDCLIPLEKELASSSVSDPEREYTYRLAENIDTQLKQMSEDLKEIIEHLNEANRVQDSSDPIVQIGKILNAHMNSLQWIDQRTALLSQKLQQIDQMHQNFRQENERSFSLAYN